MLVGCQKHLLAEFDASGDEGVFGLGLLGGPLYNVQEIEQMLQRARLAWIRSVRATDKPKARRWITKQQGLHDYVEAWRQA